MRTHCPVDVSEGGKVDSRWMEQLSLRDALVFSAQELGMRCVQDYSKLQELKGRTIASMVKHFLSSSVDERSGFSAGRRPREAAGACARSYP